MIEFVCPLERGLEFKWKNCFLTVHQKFLRKKRKIETFQSFSDIEQKIFGFLRKKFLQGRQTCLFVAREAIWGKSLKKNLCYFQEFRNLSKHFDLLANDCRQVCQNCSLSVPSNNLRRVHSNEKLFCFLWTLSEKILVFHWRFLRRVPKTAWYVSPKIFEGKHFFRKLLLF